MNGSYIIVYTLPFLFPYALNTENSTLKSPSDAFRNFSYASVSLAPVGVVSKERFVLARRTHIYDLVIFSVLPRSAVFF